jgi:HEPN domain-containing protein
MSDEVRDIDKIVSYWKDSAELNYGTMQNLLKSGDNSWSLFMGHLVLEKLLKAHFVRENKKHAIFTHDLLRLATKSNLELTDDMKEWLDTITTFNLNARYDDYKQYFYNLCTREFTDLWIERIEKLRQWLINTL